MRREIFGAGLAVAVWLPCPCPAQDAAAIGRGHAIAEKFCARCHAIGMRDRSPHASATPFRDIVAKGHVENLEEALGEGIVVGHPEMPQWRFGPKEVGALISYLRSLSGKG